MFGTDVFVIGGGPAGLATAIACRQSGFSVTLADSQHAPVDKTCGEGLMPEWFVAADRLGVTVPESAGFPFQGIRFVDGERSVAASFPVGSGLGLRRTALHALLVERAVEAGVQIRWGTTITNLDALGAQWIVGADGAQSCVRRWAGIGCRLSRTRRFSYRMHFQAAPWSRYVEVYWANGCQFYVAPLGVEEVALILISRDPKQRIADALPLFPELARRVSGCVPLSGERGALASARRVSRVVKENVALVGDAAGTVDPITGEGLSLAFQQAIALARSLKRGDLAAYGREHAAIMRRPRAMGELMLLLDRFPPLRKRAMAAFEEHPRLFSNLLALHVGQLDLLRAAQTAVTLGWGLVTA